MGPVVIGVAGGTGSGKTTLVARLVSALGAADASVLAHDRYYRDLATLAAAERAAFNYDHPDALETALLVANLRALRLGNATGVPIYDFTRHARTDRSELVIPRCAIIVEGILVLADPALRALMDIKVFVDVDDDTRFERRLERDMRERGRTKRSVIDQYMTTVRPMHVQFVEPTKAFADVVVTGGGYNDAALEGLLTRVRTRMASIPVRARPRPE